MAALGDAHVDHLLYGVRLLNDHRVLWAGMRGESAVLVVLNGVD